MSDYLWFEGIPFPSVGCQRRILRDLRDKFVMKDEDTVLLTYPKSGSNWLIEIICLIHSKGDPKWIQSVLIWERSFRIETIKGNPRDVLVSGYFFWNKTNFCRKSKSLEEYFNWFVQGKVPFGSWFEYVRGWLSMREWENFLMLSYEELKKDTRSTVEKICQFLGKTLEPEELELVLKYSSFQAMKENKMSNYTTVETKYIPHGVSLIRKGICGDWKNHFTVAQAEAFDKIFQEKMEGFPQELFPWE